MMDADKLKKMQQYYHSLLAQQRILERGETNFIMDKSILPLEHELQQINAEFPSLVPAFNKHNYYYDTRSGGVLYNLTAIRSYVAILISRLQTSIEQPSDIPVTENRQFPFISAPDLRAIIERDYSEIQRAYVSSCWKSVIILCGGAIEAILTDLLKLNESAAKSAESAPNKSDITRWDLSELISVAVKLKLVTAGIEKFSPSLREYRNLVHPGNEMRNRLYFSAEEARIAVEILHILHRDLSK